MFGEHLEHTEEGYIKFPRDVEIRRQLWPENVFKHPAKYNCHMVWSLVEYLTEPGQRILDPMAGCGTSMLAALSGRNVILVEIEQKYHEMQQYVMDNLVAAEPGLASRIFLIQSDCRKVLPMAGIDLVLFSPPYGEMIKRKKVSGIAAEEASSFAELPDYSKDPWNIGKLSQFMYFQVMEKVYTDLLETAPLMCIVLKDRISNQRRIRFVRQNIKLCETAGWKLVEEVKVEAGGTEFINIHESHGEIVVRDESIVIMRRK